MSDNTLQHIPTLILAQCVCVKCIDLTIEESSINVVILIINVGEKLSLMIIILFAAGYLISKIGLL